MEWLLIGIGYALCGVFAYGISLADWIGEFPNFKPRDHVGISAGVAMLGPLGLMVALFVTNFCQHGIRWRFPVRDRKRIDTNDEQTGMRRALAEAERLIAEYDREQGRATNT